ncbi:hypothetical protein QO008_001473 [Peptoniphilus ivorii]|uniref:GIY-YIG nuclease family protein n=1 Tax=Aedoeadaptatus ivorii TaxID=54006 RepID=UPI002781703A|nr:GIY-YIG nuclease family protein [Peptoniphilus ivorii]MDQ0509000.1 hypothetical protein [Peptoniphilus ivorii]
MELLQLSELSRIEPRPGIYKMYDRGALLYVGKSKQLRHRVRQYFGGSHHAPKIRHMVARIDAVGIEYTPSHLEAMLAEEREIKRLQPPYNRMLKREIRAVRFVPDRRAPLLYRLAPGGFGPVQKESFLREFFLSLRHLFPFDDPLAYHPLPLRLTAAEAAQTEARLAAIFSDEAAFSAFLDAIRTLQKKSVAALYFERAETLEVMHRQASRLGRNLFLYDAFLSDTHVLCEPTPAGNRHFVVKQGVLTHVGYEEGALQAYPYRDTATEDHRRILFSHYVQYGDCDTRGNFF